ncbi:MAG: 50S ribosomal protein L5 [Candidatus Aenigmatarchaeota archaeon]
MDNPMREIRIEKIVVNIGCGEAGEKLDKAKKVLESLVHGHKTVTTHTHDRTTFGMAKGRPIGVMVTLRGRDATDFLKRALDSVDGKLPEKCFDKQGNLSFGVREHISMPGVKYDPEIGVWGMDVCIRLERRGYRTMRKKNPSPVSRTHRITPEEARDFMVKNFEVKAGEE